jgi:iron(III) transport system substrate-binding protein
MGSGMVRGASIAALVPFIALACGGGASPNPPSVTPASAASATTATSPAWEALVAAAKQEGKLVVAGPPTPETRVNLPKAFKERFGIEMEYIAPGSTSDLLVKLEAERKAGLYTIDAIMGGAQSLYTVAYAGKMIDPVQPILIDPEAADASKWVGGRVWFMDPEGRYILRLSNYVTNHVVVNTSAVKVADITSWKSLLDPKFKGKLSFYDPTKAGTGWNTANFLLRKLGDDYVHKLYVDQQPAISSDFAQLADWMARAQYPISAGLRESEIEKLRSDGFPVEVLPPMPDAPGIVTAGFGLGVLMNKAPHPNAAKVFLNWMATREGQAAWQTGERTVSIRTDVDNSKWAAPYAVPKPGVEYFDSYDYDFTVNSRSPAELDRLKKLISR